jgi:sugar O-acyltransferase (sialic acid O-acetyltransferase NeuD family)
MRRGDLVLVGGGGHCRSVIDVIEQEGKYHILGLLDLPEKAGQDVFGYPFIGCDEDIPRLIGEGARSFLVTLGQIKTPERRMALFHRIKASGGRLPSIVSPFARVSPYALIGEGTIVMHGALVNAGARVGCNCIINSRALVEHDALVGDHCHLSTACVVNGAVRVGEGTFIGSGTVTRENITIGSGSLVGAGVLVRKSVPANSFFAGDKGGARRREGA